MSEEEKPTSSRKRDEVEPNDSEEEYSNRDTPQEESALDAITNFFRQKLSLVTSLDSDDATPPKVLNDLSFDGLIEHWKEKGFKNIITMVGAGISTSAGIPDFRSPGSGLYDNLQKYNLPYPSAIFEMDYFLDNPQPFFALAKELYPGTFNPTPCHYFVRLLHDKGLLLRHYTQNIDTLERIAGIPADKLVEAHGTFYTNHCLGCRKEYSMQWMKEKIFADHVPTCERCNSVVKPDIVFFGENLPETFYSLPKRDFAKCDLLIIMGTSLEVQPFASLISYAETNCARLLINREKVGQSSGGFGTWFMSGAGLLYDRPNNTRDVAYIGDCDNGVLALADAVGHGEALRELVRIEHERLAEENKAQRHSEGGKDNKEQMKPGQDKDSVDSDCKNQEKDEAKS